MPALRWDVVDCARRCLASVAVGASSEGFPLVVQVLRLAVLQGTAGMVLPCGSRQAFQEVFGRHLLLPLLVHGAEVRALVAHIADAFAETAEEVLPKQSQASYFHVRKALETAANHIADAVAVEFEHAGEGDFDREAFMTECCFRKKEGK